MPLPVNLRHLENENLELKGELSVEELDLNTSDEMIRAVEPLRYELEVQKLDESLLLQGRLKLTLQCQCVRCLKPFGYRIELKDWTRHLALTGEESVPVTNDCVDLTPHLREDILLEFPQHPLCKTDCGGLPKTGGRKTSDPKSGKSKPSTWAALDKLKF